MDSQCASLPPPYRAAILAGAESGQLGEALESIVDTASRLDQMRRVTGLALIYPLVLAVVACWLLSFLIVKVVPSFDWVGQLQFGPIPWLARWAWTLPLLIFVAPLVLTLAAFLFWWRSGDLRAAGGTHARSLAWFPGARRAIRFSQAATFAELLHLLIERGLPLDRSLELAAGASDDRKLQWAAGQLANQLRTGDRPVLSSADPVFRSAFPLLVRLALYHTADRELLVNSLKQASAMYRERASGAAESYAEYMPVLLTAVIGGTLTIAFTLFLIAPYASMLYTVSQWDWR
jgi:general secretion pathway protein F